MKSSIVKKSCLAVSFAFLLAGAAVAQAGPTSGQIWFLQGSGGTISYDGTGGPFTGTNIAFDEIYGYQTPTNSGLDFLNCIGCVLNFMTGDMLTEVTGDNGHYTFASGGTFTVTGQATDQVGNVVASGILLDGSIDKSAFYSTPAVSVNKTGKLAFSDDVGSNTLNGGLRNYFGFSQDVDSNFSFFVSSTGTATFEDNGGFSGPATLVRLKVNVSNVPGPGALGMFGLGLLGLVFAIRRQRRQKIL